MSVTQKDIAKKLNVSIMTVSKALKGNSDISSKTRKRVQKAAKEMNYSVNSLARSLVSRKTNTIGVIFPDISEQFYAETLRSIESVIRPHKYNILMGDSNNDAEIERDIFMTMREYRIDGLIFCPTEKSELYLDLLQNANFPYVLVNIDNTRLESDTISVDRAIGAELAIAHLLDRGYDDIYFFYTFQYMAQSQASVRGCETAFNHYKREESALNLIYCDDHELETFYMEAKKQLHFNGKKIGVFVWDDEMAVGVYRAIVEIGLDIPNQVGIVGFDDIKISKYLPSALTTINYPKLEMGKKSAERLLQRITSKRSLKPQKVKLKLKLVQRETT